MDSPVSDFSRLSLDLNEAAKSRAESPIFASVKAPRLERMEEIEQEFDGALNLLMKSLPDPFETESVSSMVGKTEVFVRNLRLTGLSTLRRHGEVLFADEEEFHLRRTATHLFVGPVKLTFKLFYGTRKRRMEVTASGILFGVRVKADKSRKEMKLDKLTMQTFDLKIRFLGEKTFDPVANLLLIALRPILKMKVRQMLETQLAAEVTKHQEKTTLKMIRMLYGIKEKPWSGLEGRLPFRKSRK